MGEGGRARALGWAAGTALVVVVVIVGTLWLSPVVMIAPWDVFILLDSGHRRLLGQSPGVDFHNPIGPLTYQLVALGMQLQEVPSLRAIGIGQAAAAAVVTPIAFVVAARRVPPAFAAGFTVFVALLLTAVRPLGYSPFVLSYAMVYNRIGWVLLAIVMLLCLVPLRTNMLAPTRVLVTEGIILGILLALLFVDKITFFLAAIGTVVLGLVIRTMPRSRRLVWSTVVSFVVAVAAALAVTGMPLDAYLSDLVVAARVQSPSGRIGILARAGYHSWPTLLATALVCTLSWRLVRRGHVKRREALRVCVVVLWIVGAAVLLSSFNAAERGDLPAVGVVALCWVAAATGWAAQRPRGSEPTRLSPMLVALGMAAVLVGPLVAKDVIALGDGVVRHGDVSNPPASQKLDSEHLADFVIPTDASWGTAYRQAHDVPPMINDGLSMLRRHVAPTDTVFTMAVADPFSFALDLVPPVGGLAWWDLSYDFDLAHAPAPGKVLVADWVMVPRLRAGEGCCQETVTTMLRLYGDALAEEYVMVESSGDWQLWRRRTG